jgi:hypothetical protein
MSEGISSQTTPQAAESGEADWLTWSEGTVLPDEMIDRLRETIGALDALLASTYLSRDFELPGPDDLMPSVDRAPAQDPAPAQAQAQAPAPSQDPAPSEAPEAPEVAKAPKTQAARPQGGKPQARRELPEDEPPAGPKFTPNAALEAAKQAAIQAANEDAAKEAKAAESPKLKPQPPRGPGAQRNAGPKR